MNTHLLNLHAFIRAKAVLATIALIASSIALVSAHAQTAPPPNFGEDTKGTPAIEESNIEADSGSVQAESAATNTTAETTTDETQTTSAFGRATVVESRRESGQVYSIELQHSNAPNQYIEETDSDGNIEYKSNDVEETPNLPKWKLGSW